MAGQQQQQGAPAKMQTIPFFHHHYTERKEILQRAIHAYMNEKHKMQGFASNTTHCYRMRDAFSTADCYWIKNVRGERFKGTFTRGILYRPDIVEEMIQLIEATFQEQDCAEGIMINGPHGIGKSHSIVNLVRKLLYDSNGQYLVTFVPDCEKWIGLGDLYEAICGSFGCTMEGLGMNSMGTTLDKEIDQLDGFVEAIDSILAENGMKWVFVFDQINCLFTRPEFAIVKDLGTISFPFCAIKILMKVGRIASIISMSADNSIVYKNILTDFVEYHHCHHMSINEINTVFQEVTKLSDNKRNKVYEVTGCIPLQIVELIKYDFFIEKYQEKALELIMSSLEVLEETTYSRVFQGIANSALACLLSLCQEDKNHDCKYSFCSNRAGRKYYMPLFPMVLVAYRAFFWDSVLTLVKSNKCQMLQACKNQNVTIDMCGQLFELIVIHCLSTNANVTLNVDWTFPRLLNCTLVKTFSSKGLPNDIIENGMYVPLNSNFPAIDLILKCENSVCGVQIHIATHNGNEEVFERLCTEAGWFDQFDNVCMLYLSPTKEVAFEMQRHLSLCQQKRIHVAAASIHDVSCLYNIEWPEVNLN